MGYQNKTVSNDTFEMIVGTFVNTTDSDQLLKDYAIKSLSGTRFSLGNMKFIFFGADGNPLLVKNDETLKTFCPEAYAAFGGEDSKTELSFGYYRTTGWFLASDSGRTYPMDNYPIIPGRGFNVYVSGHEDGVEITSSGEVSQSDFTVTVPNDTFQMIGNAMPTDCKLKDITVESLSGTRFSLGNMKFIFFGADGNPLLVKNDETLKTFCPEAYAAFGGEDSKTELSFGYYRTTGWFLASDSGRTYPMDDYPIAAMRGFNVYVSGHEDGVKVTIPSPLQDAEASK